MEADEIFVLLLVAVCVAAVVAVAVHSRRQERAILAEKALETAEAGASAAREDSDRSESVLRR